MRRLSVMLALVGLVAGEARMANAQGYQGGIRGAVTDAAGVVPGAEVTAINEETAISRTTTTNAAGEYNLPNLAPGLYGLKVSMTGFRAVTQKGLQVGTGKFPWNTDGGGLCNNHPANRGGMTKIIEAVRQLRGEAHPKVQVPNCTLALAHGTGGAIGHRHGSGTLIMERE